MNDVVLEEKLELIDNSIEVVTKFNLYRRGYLEIESCPDPKDIGEALDTLLGIAYEYEDIVRENNALREVMKKEKSDKNDYKEKLEKMLQEAKDKKAEEKLPPINMHKHNGENDALCKDCENYDKNGMCRWGECMWYSRKPMAFDYRVCCQTCSFHIDDKCTYLKEQDKRVFNGTAKENIVK